MLLLQHRTHQCDLWELFSLCTQSTSVSYKWPLIKHYDSPLFQAGLLSYLSWVSSLCMLFTGHNKAPGFLHASGGERQKSNYNGMGGRGIVRGRTDAERQEKTISLIQLINIINVIIFLLWFKHSIQESCLLVKVSDKSLQIQKARCCMAVTVFPQTSINVCWLWTCGFLPLHVFLKRAHLPLLSAVALCFCFY